MELINGKYQAPSKAEHDGFENSRFSQGETVEILLRHPIHGGVMGRTKGVCIQRHENVDVSEGDEEPYTKTLVQLKGIGEEYSEDEAWFAEDALRKEESDLLNGVSFN